MHTVLLAYQQLPDEHLIELQQGRGAFASENAGHASVRLGELVAQVAAEAHKLGLGPRDFDARLDKLMGEGR